MKKSRRRFFLSLMCLLTFLFTAPLLVSAEGENMRGGCTHPSTANRSETQYYILSNSEHERQIITTTYCTVCDRVLSEHTGPLSSQPHDMSLSYSDSYHSGIRHTWIYNCVCGYSSSTTLPCSGPPCSSPMSLDDLEPCAHSSTTHSTVQQPVSDTASYSVVTISCADCGAALATYTGPIRNLRPENQE